MFSYKGRKIQLRPVQPDDKERSIIWRNDPEIGDMALSYRYPVMDSMEDSWYKKILTGEDQSNVYFSIVNITDGKHIGFVHLYNIDYIARNAFLGIVIGDKSEHRNGKATEAIHIIICYAFMQLNLIKINLEVASFNNKAISLYKTLGFMTEGILRKQLFLSGKYYDKQCMCIFRDDYYIQYPEYKLHEITDEVIENKPAEEKL